MLLKIKSDEFAKKLGAKDLSDLSIKIKDQVSSQYLSALNSISKQEILDQLENSHKVEIPKNLLENEIKSLSNDPNLNKKDNPSKAASKELNLD